MNIKLKRKKNYDAHILMWETNISYEKKQHDPHPNKISSD